MKGETLLKYASATNYYQSDAEDKNKEDAVSSFGRSVASGLGTAAKVGAGVAAAGVAGAGYAAYKMGKPVYNAGKSLLQAGVRKAISKM